MKVEVYLDSLEKEVKIYCKKKMGKVKFIFVDEDTNEVLDEITKDNLELDKSHIFDFEDTNKYSILSYEEEYFEQEEDNINPLNLLEEMKGLIK